MQYLLRVLTQRRAGLLEKIDEKPRFKDIFSFNAPAATTETLHERDALSYDD